MRPLRSSRQRSRGQALTEFALVLVPFLLLLYGIIEFGRYVYTVEVMNNAARDGARYAIVHGANSLSCAQGPMESGTSCDATGEATKDIVRKSSVGVVDGVTFPPLACSGLHPDTNPCWPVFNNRGDTVTVVARTTFTTFIPIIPLGVTVEGSSTLVINN
jgi:Flp pilus assembly protein TadG